jgi:hypothetical protein
MQGDLALAQELLDGVYRLVHDPATSEWMKWRYSMHLFASLGDFWLVRGDRAKAQEFAAQCLDIATHTNSRKYVVRAGGFSERSPWLAASGTRQQGGCGKLSLWPRRWATRPNSGRPTLPWVGSMPRAGVRSRPGRRTGPPAGSSNGSR